MRWVSRSVSGNLPWRKNCHLHTCLWPKWSPHPLQENMCCLGRYKGVILLLGTSSLRNHFISPFSHHRSLYLISYSRVWLPQTGQTPFIFIWKTHLMLERWQRMEVESCGRNWGKFLYGMWKDHSSLFQPDVCPINVAIVAPWVMLTWYSLPL